MSPQDRSNHTPLQTFRFPKGEQDELARNAARAGTTKSDVLAAFARWYNRTPGAKLPRRPPAEPKVPHPPTE